jgi:hypothetical protein
MSEPTESSSFETTSSRSSESKIRLSMEFAFDALVLIETSTRTADAILARILVMGTCPVTPRGLRHRSDLFDAWIASGKPA